MRTRLAGVAGFLVLALALTACGGDEAGDTTTTSTAATTTTSTTAPSTTTTTAMPAYPDGTGFGLIRGTQVGEIVLDPADFLTGDEAVTAAREDGVIGADEDLPNDFYIRNDVSEQVMLAVAPGATVTLLGFDQGGSPVETDISFDDLAGLFDGTIDSDGYYGFTPDALPVLVTVSDGVVTEVIQQYLP